ncbi:MAG TPA: TetR/AcrR family transcriptional regulator [Pseudonocardiaceae bacterium]|jgi:AcrR family transcriptional regulator|nr:TetR/AcrR family transcriptional regulator [Pseudonocardiaceae bacterium]
MDAVATAAGIGKATLFRAFGSRDGLLDALSDAKFAPVRQAVEGRQPPLGSDAPSRERIIAFLDAALTFKLTIATSSAHGNSPPPAHCEPSATGGCRTRCGA